MSDEDENYTKDPKTIYNSRGKVVDSQQRKRASRGKQSSSSDSRSRQSSKSRLKSLPTLTEESPYAALSTIPGTDHLSSRDGPSSGRNNSVTLLDSDSREGSSETPKNSAENTRTRSVTTTSEAPAAQMSQDYSQDEAVGKIGKIQDDDDISFGSDDDNAQGSDPKSNSKSRSRHLSSPVIAHHQATRYESMAQNSIADGEYPMDRADEVNRSQANSSNPQQTKTSDEVKMAQVKSDRSNLIRNSSIANQSSNDTNLRNKVTAPASINDGEYIPFRDIRNAVATSMENTQNQVQMSNVPQASNQTVPEKDVSVSGAKNSTAVVVLREAVMEQNSVNGGEYVTSVPPVLKMDDSTIDGPPSNATVVASDFTSLHSSIRHSSKEPRDQVLGHNSITGGEYEASVVPPEAAAKQSVVEGPPSDMTYVPSDSSQRRPVEVSETIATSQQAIETKLSDVADRDRKESQDVELQSEEFMTTKQIYGSSKELLDTEALASFEKKESLDDLEKSQNDGKESRDKTSMSNEPPKSEAEGAKEPAEQSITSSKKDSQKGERERKNTVLTFESSRNWTPKFSIDERELAETPTKHPTNETPASPASQKQKRKNSSRKRSTFSSVTGDAKGKEIADPVSKPLVFQGDFRNSITTPVEISQDRIMTPVQSTVTTNVSPRPSSESKIILTKKKESPEGINSATANQSSAQKNQEGEEIASAPPFYANFYQSVDADVLAANQKLSEKNATNVQPRDDTFKSPANSGNFSTSNVKTTEDESNVEKGYESEKHPISNQSRDNSLNIANEALASRSSNQQGKITDTSIEGNEKSQKNSNGVKNDGNECGSPSKKLSPGKSGSIRSSNSNGSHHTEGKNFSNANSKEDSLSGKEERKNTALTFESSRDWTPKFSIDERELAETSTKQQMPTNHVSKKQKPKSSTRKGSTFSTVTGNVDGKEIADPVSKPLVFQGDFRNSVTTPVEVSQDRIMTPVQSTVVTTKSPGASLDSSAMIKETEGGNGKKSRDPSLDQASESSKRSCCMASSKSCPDSCDGKPASVSKRCCGKKRPGCGMNCMIGSSDLCPQSCDGSDPVLPEPVEACILGTEGVVQGPKNSTFDSTEGKPLYPPHFSSQSSSVSDSRKRVRKTEEGMVGPCSPVLDTGPVFSFGSTENQPTDLSRSLEMYDRGGAFLEQYSQHLKIGFAVTCAVTGVVVVYLLVFKRGT